MTTKKTDYEVGYRKPPKHTRFRPGQSGNPKGRPKGRRNLATDVREVLARPVQVSDGGRKRNVSTQIATLLRLREKALKGDAKAMDRMLALAGVFNNDEEVVIDDDSLSPDDEAILAIYNQRHSSAVSNGEDAVVIPSVTFVRPSPAEEDEDTDRQSMSDETDAVHTTPVDEDEEDDSWLD